MKSSDQHERRDFLNAALGAAIAAGVASVPILGQAATHRAKTKATTTPDKEHKEEKHGEEVAPAEDLMREHGVLNRILLIYDESIRRLNSAPGDLPPETLVASA